MIEQITDFMMIRYPNVIYEKYMCDSVSYVGKYEDKTIAIVINRQKKGTKTTEKNIKSMSSNLNKFYNENKNTEFYYFVKNEKNIQANAFNYLCDKMCLLNFASLDLAKIHEKKERTQEETKVVKSKVSKAELAKKKKGNDYEIHCGKIIEAKDFIIKYNGLENGVNDNSIDVIAISKNDILLIQCKAWSIAYCKKNGYLSRTNFSSFVGQCDDFVRNNRVYQNFKIFKVWFVSDLETVDKDGLAYAHEQEDFMLQEIKM